MSANDPGCVKTRKFGESRECFFLHQLKSDMLANICAPKRGLDKRLFYRRHASSSFDTAKTHKRHWLCIAAMDLMPVSAPIKMLD